MVPEDWDIRNRIDQYNTDEVEKIYLETNNSVKQLIIKFKSGNKELSDLTNTQYTYHLSEKSIILLEDIIDNNQDELISCAKGYFRSGRDYYIFFYDLASLCWLIEKLPDRFQRLKKIQSDGNELLHNRLTVQLAFEYQKRFSQIEYEKDFHGSKPDLFINSVNIEVKNILVSMAETDYQEFYDSFKRQFEKARRQIHNDGMIIMGFWSKRINNELKEYFKSSVEDKLTNIEKNITVLVIEGDKPLKEHYICLPIEQTLESIKNYCDGGHNQVDPMAYMKTMMRNGFPKQTSTHDGFMMFRTG